MRKPCKKNFFLVSDQTDPKTKEGQRHLRKRQGNRITPSSLINAWWRNNKGYPSNNPSIGFEAKLLHKGDLFLSTAQTLFLSMFDLFRVSQYSGLADRSGQNVRDCNQGWPTEAVKMGVIAMRCFASVSHCNVINVNCLININPFSIALLLTLSCSNGITIFAPWFAKSLGMVRAVFSSEKIRANA